VGSAASAVPTAATVVVEICKIWGSYLRAVRVAAIAEVIIVLLLVPGNRVVVRVVEVEVGCPSRLREVLYWNSTEHQQTCVSSHSGLTSSLTG
jgi:hypothetical protein